MICMPLICTNVNELQDVRNAQTCAATCGVDFLIFSWDV